MLYHCLVKNVFDTPRHDIYYGKQHPQNINPQMVCAGYFPVKLGVGVMITKGNCPLHPGLVIDINYSGTNRTHDEFTAITCGSIKPHVTLS